MQEYNMWLKETAIFCWLNIDNIPPSELIPQHVSDKNDLDIRWVVDFLPYLGKVLERNV